VSARQNVGPLDREGRCLFQPPLPPDEATSALAAAAGISTVGLRPSFVIPTAAHSHPDCRAILILIVAPHQAGGPAGERRRKTGHALGEDEPITLLVSTPPAPEAGMNNDRRSLSG